MAVGDMAADLSVVVAAAAAANNVQNSAEVSMPGDNRELARFVATFFSVGTTGNTNVRLEVKETIGGSARYIPIATITGLVALAGQRVEINGIVGESLRLGVTNPTLQGGAAGTVYCRIRRA